ncbi:hypothetical protein FB451DRAFT_102346 [Mycena latifolia]|nr:hypothetical protein FB451DRAFT_102346 [Mycena latifolia]
MKSPLIYGRFQYVIQIKLPNETPFYPNLNMADAARYSRLQHTNGFGFALFHPQPFDDLPPTMRQTGTRIGDVGIVTPNGAFDPIFNILDRAEDNRSGVPQGFEQVRLRDDAIAEQRRCHLAGSDISNTTIKKKRLDVNVGFENNVFLPAGAGAVIEVSTNSKETAILLLPDGASRWDLRTLQIFRDYASKHAQSWYEFVNGVLGRMIGNGDLYLVTGVTKSTSWSVASLEKQSGDGELSLKLKAAQVATAGVSCTWEWESANSSVNSGPNRFPGEESWRDNQTVFLRGFKVSVRTTPLKRSPKLVSIANSKWPEVSAKSSFIPFSQSRPEFSSTNNLPSSPAGGSSSDNVSDDGSLDCLPNLPHPLDEVNEFLLNCNPDAMVAVTHDDELNSILTEADDEVPECDELIRRILNKFTVETTSDGVYLQDRSADNSISVAPGQHAALDNVQKDGRLQPPLYLPAWDSSLNDATVDSPDRSCPPDSLEDSPGIWRTVSEYANLLETPDSEHLQTGLGEQNNMPNVAQKNSFATPSRDSISEIRPTLSSSSSTTTSSIVPWPQAVADSSGGTGGPGGTGGVCGGSGGTGEGPTITFPNSNVYLTNPDATKLQSIKEKLANHITTQHKVTDQSKSLCASGTRVEIQADILKWLSPQPGTNEHIFWVTGIAGSGKSTLSATVVENLREKHTPVAAQFFISRNIPETVDPSKIIPTVAKQLAEFSPAAADIIHDTLASSHSSTVTPTAEHLLDEENLHLVNVNAPVADDDRNPQQQRVLSWINNTAHPLVEPHTRAKFPSPGACTRCKNLKMKCEFKTETDPCKRCFNGGHHCVTPGRKKYKMPPNHEHLLKQIHEQAAETQKLEALHDSVERFPEPACHPGTRTAVLEELKSWSVDTSPESTILWLHGCAGMGKSAIAQMFGTQLEKTNTGHSRAPNSSVAHALFFFEKQRTAYIDIAKSIRHVVQNQEQYDDSVQRQRILDWYSPLNFVPRQADIFSARQPGIGEWLLNDTEFKVELTPDGRPDMPSLLGNLGNSLLTRFERLGDLTDLNESVTTLKVAVNLTPEGHPVAPSRPENLGNSLLRLFERLGDLRDLNQAVAKFEATAKLTPDGHPDRPSRTGNLDVNAMGGRYGSALQAASATGDVEIARLRVLLADVNAMDHDYGSALQAEGYRQRLKPAVLASDSKRIAVDIGDSEGFPTNMDVPIRIYYAGHGGRVKASDMWSTPSETRYRLSDTLVHDGWGRAIVVNSPPTPEGSNLLVVLEAFNPSINLQWHPNTYNRQIGTLMFLMHIENSDSDCSTVWLDDEHGDRATSPSFKSNGNRSNTSQSTPRGSRVPSSLSCCRSPRAAQPTVARVNSSASQSAGRAVG